MKNNPNFYHDDILKRIEELKVLKTQQESTISMKYSELLSSLNLGSIVKESIMHFATDKQTQKDLVQMVTKSGTNYIIEKFLGSNNSIKRYLGSMLAEKVSNTFIGSMISKI